MDVGGLISVIDRLAPFALAEDWDNVGLMVGRRDRPVARVLVALDLREAVLDEVLATGADCVLVHHPPIFPALSAVSDARAAGRLVLRAAEERVAVVAAHTNLDAATGGLNDIMAAALGLSNTSPLVPVSTLPSQGLGRVGDIAPTTLDGLAALAVAAFAPRRANLAVAGDSALAVRRVALCTGSGGSLIGAARDAGADAYVTGDLKYHDFDAAEGMGLVNLPHAAVEATCLHQWVPVLAAALAGDGVEVIASSVDTDPWREAC